MSAQIELLPQIDRKRAAPRVMAHMVDCGAEATQFECCKCGWSSGWMVQHFTATEIRKGIPCERCNPTLSAREAMQP
jgi:hypothetical protein